MRGRIIDTVSDAGGLRHHWSFSKPEPERPPLQVVQLNRPILTPKLAGNSWAALMLVWAVLHHDGVSRFLEGSVPQYLGSISFSMYLLHGPVLHMTAFALVPMMWRTGFLGRTLGFLAPVLLVVIPSVVLAADLFTRTIESRIHHLIRSLERAA